MSGCLGLGCGAGGGGWELKDMRLLFEVVRCSQIDCGDCCMYLWIYVKWLKWKKCKRNVKNQKKASCNSIDHLMGLKIQIPGPYLQWFWLSRSWVGLGYSWGILPFSLIWGPLCPWGTLCPLRSRGHGDGGSYLWRACHVLGTVLITFISS